jgi:hypothetical protein
MNRLFLLVLPLLVMGCDAAPKIVSDDHMKESPIIQGLRHNIVQGSQTTSWGWILWYLPVLVLALAWAWREFISKRKSTLAAKGKPSSRQEKKKTSPRLRSAPAKK